MSGPPGERSRLHLPLPRRGTHSRVDPAPTQPSDRGRTPVAHSGASAIHDAVVDCAFYDGEGERAGGNLRFREAVELINEHDHGFAWIGVHDPTPEALDAVAHRFGLHPLAVEDAIHAHQRPKLERHDDTLFVVLKTARYVDSRELVEVGELMVFVGPRFVITVRHGQASPLRDVRQELEAHPTLLQLGPSAVLYAVVDKVVDDYTIVLDGLDYDVSEIEADVFDGDLRTNPAQRIYLLKREVLEFRRALVPLDAPLTELASGRVPCLPERSAEYFADVRDHLLRDIERVHGIDELLTSALNANLTQLTMRDNQDMRRISAAVAILAVPTMVFGLYGMNFEHMPELSWRYGYPAVLLVTLAICGLLYRRFRRSGWL